MSRGPIHAGAVILGAISVAFGAIVLTLGGCAHRSSAKIPRPAKIGSTETGIASWYGVPYNGRPTASGEIYDMERITAAHRTLPFGTWLEVLDLDNGKKVEVRINDRGPFVKHRVIDLSLGAAREIEMVGPGTARVRLKVIAPPPVSDPIKSVDFYAVQAGAFSAADRAENFAASLREKFPDVRVERVEASGSLWRVLVGRALPIEEAKRLAEKVRSAGGEALVVADR